MRSRPVRRDMLASDGLAFAIPAETTATGFPLSRAALDRGKAMTTTSLEGLLKMFSFEKKQDLERYCRQLNIHPRDFFELVLACEHSGNPFCHQITYRDKMPGHLVPSDSEIEALGKTPV